MQTLEVAKGTDSVFDVTFSPAGTGVLTYTTATPLVVYLWRGEDQANIAGLTASITTAPNLATLTIPASAIATLEAGVYSLRIVANGTDWAAELALRILDAPGSGTLPAVYCSRRDMTDAVPWIESVQDIAEDLTGYAEQRAQARAWIEEEIISRATDILWEQSSRHYAIVPVDPIVPTEGVDAGPEWGPSIYPHTTIRDQLETLRTYLATGKLIQDSQLRRATAFFAVGRVLESKIGNGPDGTSYQVLGAMYRRRARKELRGWTARIDTNGDGKAEIELP